MCNVYSFIYRIYPRIGRIRVYNRPHAKLSIGFMKKKKNNNEFEKTGKQREVLNQQQLMCIKSSLLLIIFNTEFSISSGDRQNSPSSRP